MDRARRDASSRRPLTGPTGLALLCGLLLACQATAPGSGPELVAPRAAAPRSPAADGSAATQPTLDGGPGPGDARATDARATDADPRETRPDDLTTAAGPPSSQPSPPRAYRCGLPQHRWLALTFDDGPSIRFTPRILDVLRRHGVHATFFVLGRLVRRHPQLVQRMQREGHLVANHSWDHPRRADLASWRQQILRTEAVIRRAGVTPARYYRPPHGVVTPQVLALSRELGYTVVLYTLLSSDWRRPGADSLVRQVTHRLAPGGIAVLHDAGGNRSQTLEALPRILRGLRRRGFELVTLDRLLTPLPDRDFRCLRPHRKDS